MQLIKRTILHYQEGTSDKIYEVDLCQTGEDRYVVNFRYGRRGATLKEGVKTEQPVPLAQAQKAFDKLVAEKVKKGYQDVSTPLVSENLTPKPKETNPESRKQAILNCLSSNGNEKWPIERAIWRAGELKITEAVPLLIPLIGTGDDLRDYCIVWSLGFCGNQEIAPNLKSLSENTNQPEFVRRIAWEALYKISDEATKTKLRSKKIEQLPTELREKAKNGSAEEFFKILKEYLEYRFNSPSAYLLSQDYQRFAVLDTIYQIDNEFVRPALLEVLQTVKFLPNFFKRVRHIFKMAEYRQDAEVFGILAYRFEKEKGTFRSDGSYVYIRDVGYLRKYNYQYNNQTRRYDRTENFEFQKHMQSPDAKVAYSNLTRDYLRRRVWRSLKTLGEQGDTNYVKMAAKVLLQYSNTDAERVREKTSYRWDYVNNRSLNFKQQWDSYAGYLTFNHILYENSPRYELKANSKAWICRNNYKAGDPEPNVREEAFPELWQQQPDEVLQLLLESSCRPVHHFAVKVLRDCPQFCAEIEAETVIKLLNKLYDVTVQFAFELARNLYSSAEPNKGLVLAVLNCIIPEARAEAYRWIEESRDRYLSDINFIADLVTSSHQDTRLFARRLLSSSILDENTVKLAIARIITELLTFNVKSEINSVYQDNIAEKAKDVAETLLACFTSQLRTLGMSVIDDLLKHPLLEVQELGARILLNHEISAVDLPPGLIDSLMNSSHESIRGVGIRIFGQLPDNILLNEYPLLVTMITHELADIRNAIRPAIRRLSENYPDFAARLATEMIDVLMKPEAKEGIHASLVRLLKEDLPGWMTGVNKDIALRLLRANSSATQELAGYVISANRENWADDFETIEIVKLADNEILSVREAGREMFLHNLNRYRANEQEMLSAVRIVECKWEDSREFGFRLFSTFFTGEDLTPSVLITLCDSIREDVRSFGRNLVTRYFNEADGQEYLLKFSEHPTTDMQVFATNYLENYAVNNPERLQQLKPYFISVLSRVNKGRVAKQRIFAFLDKEAQRSEEAARIVAEILTRQSVTMAIGDKAIAIQSMVKIKKIYPHLELPIQVKSVSEVRTADKSR